MNEARFECPVIGYYMCSCNGIDSHYLPDIPSEIMTGSLDESIRIRESLEAPERVVLCIIGANGSPIGGAVNLQKVTFMVANTVSHILGGVYSFEPHKMGPYSEDVAEMVRDFTGMGLVDSKLNLTESGSEVYKLIDDGLKEPLRGAIEFWKEFIEGITEDELLTFVYTSFPEMVRNSDIVERVMGNKERNTLSLVRKGKISAGRGAEILGMGYYEFEDVLLQKGIRWKS